MGTSRQIAHAMSAEDELALQDARLILAVSHNRHLRSVVDIAERQRREIMELRDELEARDGRAKFGGLT
jgi:hypothetical protein